VSVATNKALVVAKLSALGYREIPENNYVDAAALSSNHKAYSLKWVGTQDFTYLTSSKMMWSNVFTLEIKYKNINATERDANAQFFLDLLEDITEITGFMGFAGDATFEDIDNKHTKATIGLIIGAESTC
jgi:hypothetical protein